METKVAEIKRIENGKFKRTIAPAIALVDGGPGELGINLVCVV